MSRDGRACRRCSESGIMADEEALLVLPFVVELDDAVVTEFDH
jgi:hypothetical protein